jgi:hypothetical protein
MAARIERTFAERFRKADRVAVPSDGKGFACRGVGAQSHGPVSRYGFRLDELVAMMAFAFGSHGRSRKEWS